MPLQIDSFLFILRLLLVVLLYLFLMQVVIAITRDLRKTTAASADAGNRAPQTQGHLVVVDSGPSNILPGTRFALASQTNIGRGPTNTIQITDNFISAEHTRLWLRNGTWYVQDAGSVNGTYVNNQPAREALPARNGDIIRVGYIQFKLTQ
ncbi:FHA domain-containing protein [Ktedonosporobacter rubrisoli]|uniref:FHA domain-containing protein n=1 Tax=Ktedonosporobacter rubrisoli TaxID=2509675 RepID=A0A4P6K1X9_KTERU|nr:FHA domain-containing protein [Ktedonosporobacter rubrisoli]QBD81995.1 FHA domain-containing protein [Ktedonosporobacter rubrisoli]